MKPGYDYGQPQPTCLSGFILGIDRRCARPTTSVALRHKPYQPGDLKVWALEVGFPGLVEELTSGTDDKHIGESRSFDTPPTRALGLEKINFRPRSAQPVIRLPAVLRHCHTERRWPWLHRSEAGLSIAFLPVLGSPPCRTANRRSAPICLYPWVNRPKQL